MNANAARTTLLKIINAKVVKELALCQSAKGIVVLKDILQIETEDFVFPVILLKTSKAVKCV